MLVLFRHRNYLVYFNAEQKSDTKNLKKKSINLIDLLFDVNKEAVPTVETTKSVHVTEISE